MHTLHSKEKLILRTRRITGQIKAIEKSIQADEECAHILQHLSACRGALNGLMSELIEEHILHHVLDPKAKHSSSQAEAAEQLIDIVNTYLK